MNKLTKLNVLLIASLSTGLAMANIPAKTATHFASQSPFSGWFIGAAVGPSSLNSKNFTRVDLNTTPPIYNFLQTPNEGWESKWHAGSYNALGELFGGYGKVVNTHYYLGGELFLRLSHNTIDPLRDINVSEADNFYAEEKVAKIKNNYSYGAAIKLGYLISPKIMAYLVGGVDRAKFKFEGSDIIFSPSFQQSYYEKEKTQTGWLLGFGLETFLTDKLALRAQYDYTHYPSLKKVAAIIDDGIRTIKIEPYRSVFTVGLNYYFG